VGTYLVGHRRFVSAGILALAVLGLSALGYCGRGEQAADWRGWAREGALGLSFAMPPGRVLEMDATSIELVNPAAYRTIDIIALYPDGPPPPIRVGDGPVLRQGGLPAPFTIRQDSGGSGGPGYTLSTTKIVNGQSISLLASVQSEFGTPSFDEAWAVWESLQQAE